jgi:hypothetical protein
MDTQSNGTEDTTEAIGMTSPAAQTPSLDPLRRVLVPVEKLTSRGTVVFRTTDNTMYARTEPGAPMHRVDRKVRGKKARAHDKLMRRLARVHGA